MRVSSITAVLAAPLYALADVAFTNDGYDGITAGSPFTLTWAGNGDVMFSQADNPGLNADTNTLASNDHAPSQIAKWYDDSGYNCR